MTDSASSRRTTHVLALERTFDAPREAVFDAWTDPEVLRRWFAAGPDWDTPVAEVDLRVGGGYRLTMHDPTNDIERTVLGSYLEIVRPERLVYTWMWEREPGSEPSPETTVTVEFIAVSGAGARTTVLLRATGFLSTHDRDQHSSGFAACLDNLARRIFPTDWSTP